MKAMREVPKYETIMISEETQNKCLQTNPSAFVNEIAKEVFIYYAKKNKISLSSVGNTSLFAVNGTSTKVRVIAQSILDDENTLTLYTPTAGYMNESSTVSYLFPVFYNKKEETASFFGFIEYDKFKDECDSYLKGKTIPGFKAPCKFNAFVLTAEKIIKSKLHKSFSDFNFKAKNKKENLVTI